METKYVRVPFEVELAKKITNGEIGGRIVTRNGESVRIVCFNRKDEFRPIIALVNSGDIEVHYAFSLNGKFVNDDVLDTHDLMIEIPEYMTFKDGDVVVTENIAVVIRNPKMDDLNGFCFRLYVAYDLKKNSLFYCADFINQERVRLATENEKQILIDALKASQDPRAKEYLKRFFGIEVKQEYEFKPFDKVLTRDNSGIWICSLFSHISNSQKKYKYITVAGSFEQCIPYNEQTAHLLGTTENYE